MILDGHDILLCVFDVDGTLTTTKSGTMFRKSADDWQWLPDRLDKLRELSSQGVILAIASNQGGVAFGYMEEAELLAELQVMAMQANISHIEACFTHPKASIAEYRREDICRKPSPGMIQEAMARFEILSSRTLMVGDREEDRLAAEAAKCRFMWAWEFFGDDPPLQG